MGTATVADLRATRRLFAAALALIVGGTALAADCSDPSGPDWFWGPARGILMLLLWSPLLLVYGAGGGVMVIEIGPNLSFLLFFVGLFGLVALFVWRALR